MTFKTPQELIVRCVPAQYPSSPLVPVTARPGPSPTAAHVSSATLYRLSDLLASDRPSKFVQKHKSGGSRAGPSSLANSVPNQQPPHPGPTSQLLRLHLLYHISDSLTPHPNNFSSPREDNADDDDPEECWVGSGQDNMDPTTHKQT